MNKQNNRNKINKIKTLAFNLGNESVKYYVTVLTADEIFKFSKVSRVDEDPEQGYQRLLSEQRANAISEYISSGNIIPGAIIVSAQKTANVSFDEQTNIISIDLIPNSFFIIDGQHRLYGSFKADPNTRLPVCILADLDHKKEVEYFIDINSTQRGVPKTLSIELLKFLSEPDSIDDIRNRLFKDLNNDIESPIYGKMSATTSKVGKLSLVPFKSAIDPILNSTLMSHFNFDDKKKLILNFLKSVDEILNEVDGNSQKLYQAVFFQAIFKNFEKVLNLSLMYYGNYQTDSIEKILSNIKNIDFDKFSGSNVATLKKLSDEISVSIDLYCQKLHKPNVSM